MIVQTEQYKYKIELTKLPEDVKTRWVNALRSGNYEQGSSALLDIISCTDGEKKTYCCLGVLGAICGIDEDKLEDKEFLTPSYNIEEDMFPEGMEDFLNNTELQQFLADNNDGSIVEETGEEEIGKVRKQYPKATFLELADWIETNL